MKNLLLTLTTILLVSCSPSEKSKEAMISIPTTDYEIAVEDIGSTNVPAWVRHKSDFSRGYSNAMIGFTLVSEIKPIDESNFTVMLSIKPPSDDSEISDDYYTIKENSNYRFTIRYNGVVTKGDVKLYLAFTGFLLVDVKKEQFENQEFQRVLKTKITNVIENVIQREDSEMFNAWGDRRITKPKISTTNIEIRDVVVGMDIAYNPAPSGLIAWGSITGNRDVINKTIPLLYPNLSPNEVMQICETAVENYRLGMLEGRKHLIVRKKK